MTTDQAKREWERANIQLNRDYTLRLTKRHEENHPLVRASAAHTILLIQRYREKWGR